jgi:hypothetical protein
MAGLGGRSAAPFVRGSHVSAPRFLADEVYRAAARRAGMALALLCAFAHFASLSGAPAAAPAAAPAHVVVRNGLDPVSAAPEERRGPPLSEADKGAVLAEAAAGAVGPAMTRLIAEGDKRGDLDVPLSNGKTLRQTLQEARSAAARAEAQGEASRRAQYEALGANPGSDAPEQVMPRLIAQLAKGDEERVEAAQQLCDVRYARLPAAEAAIPALEAMERENKPEFEWAGLALKRIRYFKAKR